MQKSVKVGYGRWDQWEQEGAGMGFWGPVGAGGGWLPCMRVERARNTERAMQLPRGNAVVGEITQALQGGTTSHRKPPGG